MLLGRCTGFIRSLPLTVLKHPCTEHFSVSLSLSKCKALSHNFLSRNGRWWGMHRSMHEDPHWLFQSEILCHFIQDKLHCKLGIYWWLAYWCKVLFTFFYNVATSAWVSWSDLAPAGLNPEQKRGIPYLEWIFGSPKVEVFWNCSCGFSQTEC